MVAGKIVGSFFTVSDETRNPLDQVDGPVQIRVPLT